jgi:hypothetical protein
VTVAGLALGAEYIGDYFAAVALGIVFQSVALGLLDDHPLDYQLAG